jgi:hypothetical protein
MEIETGTPLHPRFRPATLRRAAIPAGGRNELGFSEIGKRVAWGGDDQVRCIRPGGPRQNLAGG